MVEFLDRNPSPNLDNLIRVNRVKGKQCGANKEENRGNGQIKPSAQPDALLGFALAPRGVISLNKALIDSKVVQVDENAVNQHDPKRRFDQATAE